MRTSDLQPAQFRRRPATSNAAFSVLFAVCVRHSGRFVMSHLAGCSFCTRSDTPWAVSDRRNGSDYEARLTCSIR